VEAVLTYGTKFNWDPEISRAEAAKLDPDLLREKAPAFIDQQKALHGVGWEACMREVAGLMLDLGQGGALQPEELQRIRARVLCLVGAEDRMVTAAETQEICSLLPDGEMRVVPGGKHALDSVPAEVLADALRMSFLPDRAPKQKRN
jgi:pimeloyl-ACP methyl ester carboxylesterase